MNISNNVSSIQAHQTMLNTNANNIANVNSDGFIPNDTNIINNNNSLSVITRETSDNGSKTSQTDLAKEIPDQITIEKATQANIATIKTQDSMLGTLLDLKA